MGFAVDDIVTIKGRVTEVVENSNGKFVRVRVKTTSGAQELNFEDDDIEAGTVATPEPSNNEQQDG